jgi:hypothetical protein
MTKSCGTCALWGRNFYTWAAVGYLDTCCADAVMDLPASFIPIRQTMRADQGEGCICWEPVRDTAPVDRSGEAIETRSGSTEGESAVTAKPAGAQGGAA